MRLERFPTIIELPPEDTMILAAKNGMTSIQKSIAKSISGLLKARILSAFVKSFLTLPAATANFCFS